MSRPPHTNPKDTARRPVVAVFGSGARLSSDEPLYAHAYALGTLLAEVGYTVVTGGYAGVMAAASRGAHDAGGRVAGYTLSLFDPAAPNEWVAEEYRVATFGDRLRILCEDSDAYVVLGGGVGTLTELCYTWSLLLTGAVPRRPLIALSGPWRSFVEHLRREGYPIREQHYELVQMVDTPAEAVELLRAHFHGIAPLENLAAPDC